MPPRGKDEPKAEAEAEPLQHWPVYEHEERCQALFRDLTKLFKKIERTNKPDKVHLLLKELTAKLKETKALIKEFEHEARADGMPTELFQERRRALVNGLNGFIAQKNELKQLNADRSELMTGAQLKEEEDINKMSTQQLMTKGKRELKETDEALGRAERIVEDTIQIGQQTAAALNDQTRQLEKIVDDLNEIEFNMKKASKVIRDITRGLLTDKCIAFLMFAVLAGIITIVVLKIVKPNKNAIADTFDNSTVSDFKDKLVNLTKTGYSTATTAISDTANSAANSLNSATGSSTGRRLLDEFVRMVWEQQQLLLHDG